MENIQLLHQFQNCSGVSTDTRSIKPGMMFFALKGDNFDGNKYVEEALEKGAKVVICSSEEFKDKENCIVVKDALIALQELAREYRNTFDIPVIALTGSNGKTTTKELLVSVLSMKYKVHATQGNFNNHIGVPLTLLSMPADTELAVIEMGANHQGEIKVLSEIARPTFGLITNIGLAHLEGFGGKEGIAYGKFELFRYLISEHRPILFREDAYMLNDLAGDYDLKIVINPNSFKVNGDLYSFTPVRLEPNIRLKFSSSLGDCFFESSLFGEHNYQNIIIATAVGMYFNISLPDAGIGISTYTASNNRSQIINWKGAEVILDAYNANPSSMSMAINSFMNIEPNRPHMIILGEMKELGTYSKEAHQQLVMDLIRLNPQFVCLVGEAWKSCESIPADFHLVSSNNQAYQQLLTQPIEGSLILAKGSRSNQLEAIFTFC